MLLLCFLSSEARNLSITLCRILAQSENCTLLSDSYGEVNYSSQASPSFSVWKLNIKKRENSIPWMMVDPRILSSPFFSTSYSFWVINLHSWFQMSIYILKTLKYLSLEYHTLQFSLFTYTDTCKYGLLSTQYKMKTTSTKLRSFPKAFLLSVSFPREWR